MYINFKYINVHKKSYKHLIGSVIVIDGIIGVGKSSLGKSISYYLNSYNIPCEFFPEYLNKDLLNYYLNDIKNNAFMYQIIMANSRVETYRRALMFAKNGGVSIIDRSILGDMAFARMQYEGKHITDEQYKIYLSVIGEIEDMYEPDYTIFLQCDIDTCRRRIEKRNRKNEVTTYDVNYHKNLVESYDIIYSKYPSLKVLYLDYNDDIDLVDGELLSESYTQSILSKL